MQHVSTRLQNQVRHDAAEEVDQQPQGAGQRGGGGVGEEGPQLPHRCPDQEEEETGGMYVCMFLCHVTSKLSSQTNWTID